MVSYTSTHPKTFFRPVLFICIIADIWSESSPGQPLKSYGCSGGHHQKWTSVLFDTISSGPTTESPIVPPSPNPTPHFVPTPQPTALTQPTQSPNLTRPPFQRWTPSPSDTPSSSPSTLPSQTPSTDFPSSAPTIFIDGDPLNGGPIKSALGQGLCGMYDILEFHA